jgi:uncharacterized protein
MSQKLYLALGYFMLALGIAGVILPVIPGLPFLFFAAFCFSRGSESMHRAMLKNKYVGRDLRNWEEKGIIENRVKWGFVFFSLTTIAYMIFLIHTPLWATIPVAVALVLATAYIVTRPSR